MEQRRGAGRGQRQRDTRLQDAVAFDDAPCLRVDARQVGRVRGNRHQRTQGAWRQQRVGIQHHDVRRAGSRFRQRAQVDESERRRRRHRQQRDQLFDLAALALPTHPAAFFCAPHALSVQQQETRRAVGQGCVLGVQGRDRVTRTGQQRAVGVEAFAGGVGKVRQQRVLGPGFVAGQVVAFDLCRQHVDARAAAQQAGHHHQGVVLCRDTVLESQPRYTPRRQPFAQQPVPGRNGDLGRRQQHQQKHRDDADDAVAGRPLGQRRQGHCHQRQGGGRDRTQVQRQARTWPALGAGRCRRRRYAQGCCQRVAAVAFEPIARGTLDRVFGQGRGDVFDQRAGDRQFILPGPA